WQGQDARVAAGEEQGGEGGAQPFRRAALAMSVGAAHDPSTGGFPSPPAPLDHGDERLYPVHLALRLPARFGQGKLLVTNWGGQESRGAQALILGITPRPMAHRPQ